MFSRISEGRVEALNNIDVGERPSISEMSPDKDAHIFCTSNESINSLWRVTDTFFVNCWFCHPLKPCYLLEMAKLITHY